MKILIVEDDANNIELLTLRLEALGCSVLVATTADDGLALAVAERPALVLVDLKLENDLGQGVELIRRLREQPETENIPLIVHSVFVSHPADAPEALPHANGYLPKPFQFLELKGLVEQIRQNSVKA